MSVRLSLVPLVRQHSDRSRPASLLLRTGRGPFVFQSMSSSLDSTKLLTVGQAAAELGVARVTIRRWAAGGLLQVVRVNPRGHLRLTMASVRALGLIRPERTPLRRLDRC